jgi:hypothetical protein
VEAITEVTRTPILVVDGLAAIWKVAVATVPSEKVLVLNPKAKHVFPAQLSILPAAVVEVPAVTETRETSEVKLKLHWSPAGAAPPDSVMGRLTVPPGTPDEDPMERDTVCPHAIDCNPIMQTSTIARNFLSPGWSIDSLARWNS